MDGALRSFRASRFVVLFGLLCLACSIVLQPPAPVGSLRVPHASDVEPGHEQVEDHTARATVHASSVAGMTVAAEEEDSVDSRWLTAIAVELEDRSGPSQAATKSRSAVPSQVFGFAPKTGPPPRLGA